MKDLSFLNQYRIEHPFAGWGDSKNGYFIIPAYGIIFKIICSSEAWDHVSVSLMTRQNKIVKRCPTWEEMCFIKDLIFEPDEWVIQYHPPKSDNINNYPWCLHLWRPQNQEIPKPPPIMV